VELLGQRLRDLGLAPPVRVADGSFSLFRLLARVEPGLGMVRVGLDRVEARVLVISGFRPPVSHTLNPFPPAELPRRAAIVSLSVAMLTRMLPLVKRIARVGSYLEVLRP
jgi:hypothetical protein